MNHFKTRRYYYLLLYIPVFLIWFYTIEQIHVPENGYWVSYLPIDDKIPFVPSFALIYCLWYPFLLLPGVYWLFREPESFKRYMWFFMTGITTCLLICTVFPNGQDLRPTELDSGSIFVRLLQGVYSVDTNTNVLPSMHVVGSVAVFYGALHSKHFRRPIPLTIISVLTVLICLSTVLVKQHSILDLIIGIVISIPVWFFADWLGRRFPETASDA